MQRQLPVRGALHWVEGEERLSHACRVDAAQKELGTILTALRVEVEGEEAPGEHAAHAHVVEQRRAPRDRQLLESQAHDAVKLAVCERSAVLRGHLAKGDARHAALAQREGVRAEKAGDVARAVLDRQRAPQRRIGARCIAGKLAVVGAGGRGARRRVEPRVGGARVEDQAKGLRRGSHADCANVLRIPVVDQRRKGSGVAQQRGPTYVVAAARRRPVRRGGGSPAAAVPLQVDPLQRWRVGHGVEWKTRRRPATQIEQVWFWPTFPSWLPNPWGQARSEPLTRRFRAHLNTSTRY